MNTSTRREYIEDMHDLKGEIEELQCLISEKDIVLEEQETLIEELLEINKQLKRS